MSEQRYANWTFIVYPDSAPSDWLKLLKMYRIPFAVSPLHQPETEEDDDEKKPHYHVFLKFDNKVSYESAYNVSSVTNGTRPFNIKSGTGMYRYFAHYGAEYANKEQFIGGLDSIQCFNGFDKDQYSGYTEKEKDSKYKEICRFIRDNDITDYCVFIDYLTDNDDLVLNDYLSIIRKNPYPYVKYIDSRRNRSSDLKAKDIEQRVHDLEVLTNARR